MTELLVMLGGALWLGVLTSISPCPLATNLAAISYVSRDVGSPGKVLLAGLLYTLGRVLVYTALAALLVASVLSTPGVAQWLQANLNKFLGPLLILVGMVLLGLLSLGGRRCRHQRRAACRGWTASACWAPHCSAWSSP